MRERLIAALEQAAQPVTTHVRPVELSRAARWRYQCWRATTRWGGGCANG